MQIADPGTFEVTDKRVRVEIEVANQNKFFIADAMCNGGACSEITLPAKKIIELGLTPLRGKVTSKGSKNDVKISLRFKPAVVVTLRFQRGPGEPFEERSENLTASCHEEEYQRELLNFQGGVEAVTSTLCKRVLEKEPESIRASASSIDSGSKFEPVRVQLSPVSHRLPENLDMRVVLGHLGLEKLHVHANFATRVLEIEEEPNLVYEE